VLTISLPCIPNMPEASLSAISSAVGTNHFRQADWSIHDSGAS
jgi:hypothetical protein